MFFHQVEVSIYLKQKSGYRQLFKSPRVEWCGVMSESKQPNGLIRHVLHQLRENCPELVQKCPYYGHYQMIERKFNSIFASFYPAGIYRMHAQLTDFVSKDFFAMEYFVEITSWKIIFYMKFKFHFLIKLRKLLREFEKLCNRSLNSFKVWILNDEIVRPLCL